MRSPRRSTWSAVDRDPTLPRSPRRLVQSQFRPDLPAPARLMGDPGRVASRSTAVKRATFVDGMTTNRSAQTSAKIMPSPRRSTRSAVDRDPTLPRSPRRLVQSQFRPDVPAPARLMGDPGRVASRSTAVKRATFVDGMTTNRSAHTSAKIMRSPRRFIQSAVDRDPTLPRGASGVPPARADGQRPERDPGRVASRSTAVKRATFIDGMTTNRSAHTSARVMRSPRRFT